jgi:hypothetical protein
MSILTATKNCKMKKFLALIAVFAILIDNFAQKITFFNTAITADVSFKTTKSIALENGNFLITGQKGDDFDQEKQTKVIFKTDNFGRVLWQRNFNSAKNTGEGVIGIRPSGGFIVAAPSNNGNNNETTVFKTDATGEITGTKLLSDTVKLPELTEILVSNDNKNIFIGMAKGNFPNVDNAADIYISKQDESFNVLWSKIYSISDKEYYTASTLLTDGTIITAGIASSCGQGCVSKAYIMAVNAADGSHRSTKMINSTSYTIDNLIAAADGGFFAVVNDQGKETYNIFKFNKDLGLVFAKEYNSIPRLQLVNIKELADGHLLVAGYTDLGFSLVTLNAKGEVLAAKNLFSKFSFNRINLFTTAPSLITAIVNDYNQTRVFNFNTDGYTSCADSIRPFAVTTANLDIDFYTNTSPVFYNKPNIDKGPEFKEYTFTNPISGDIKVSNKLICESSVSGVNKTELNENIFFSPNPTNGLINIRINAAKAANSEFLLYTVYGKLVYSSIITGNLTEIDLTTMAKGIYIATIKNGTGLINNKIVLQ